MNDIPMRVRAIIGLALPCCGLLLCQCGLVHKAMTKKQKASIDISDADLAKVKVRCANEDLKVMGLRFKSDRFVPAERFQHLREQLGDGFVAVELEDIDANPEAIMRPHSVLTEHLIDQPGTKTRQALDSVLELFATRLGVA